MTFKIISGETLSQYLQDNRVLLLDLRDRKEYETSHISSAVWMNWEQADREIITLSDHFRQQHGHYPDWIILYCDSGNISLITARDLARLGYPVMSLNGGFHRWHGSIESSGSVEKNVENQETHQ